MRLTTMVTDSEVRGAELVSFRSSSSKNPPFAATTGVATTLPVPAVTVSERVAPAVTEPAWPVMVIVHVPAAAVLAAASVRVALLAPELLVVVELNEAVTPAGGPLAVNVTVPLKPARGVALTLKDELDPAAMVAVEGLTETAKPVVTVSVRVAVAVTEPAWPVTVIV